MEKVEKSVFNEFADKFVNPELVFDSLVCHFKMTEYEARAYMKDFPEDIAECLEGSSTARLGRY